MATILMTGGGTGGHLAIVDAVKSELKEHNLIYIGSTKGQDRAWFGDDEDFTSKYFLKSRGVVNQGFLGKISSIFILIKAILKVKKIFKKERVDVVFSVGGYSSAPASLSAVFFGIPLVIHEQNAVLGTLNRLLRPYSKYFISSYEVDSPIHSYPVKYIFFQKARVRDRVKEILFLGGSQGALAINNLALALAPALNERGIKITHQAGEGHIDSVKDAYNNMGIEAEVFGFSKDIPNFMARADFAIARAGASTLWELVANALPTLFIPYPYAVKDHQYYNAKFLVDKNLAWLKREDDLNHYDILKLFDEDLNRISRGLMEVLLPNGAKEIAKLIESVAK